MKHFENKRLFKNNRFFYLTYSLNFEINYMSIIKQYALDYTDIFIFDYFLINQIHEGIDVRSPYDKKLRKIIKSDFKGRDMVYISNRHFSYSVDPLIYPKIENISNMVAIALVPATELMRKNAEYERHFYDKPFEIFDSLLKAINWTESIIDGNDSKH